MASAMSSAEGSAYKGLHQCIETLMVEVERLLPSEQKATDYRSSDGGIGPDHRPTIVCTRVVAYLSRVLEAAFTALEGLNKQSFLTELGNCLHKGLMNHWEKFTFNWSGGLQLKRDITEYGDFGRSFNAPIVDEKFELLGILVRKDEIWKCSRNRSTSTQADSSSGRPSQATKSLGNTFIAPPMPT